jgi:hypothetical protein
MTMAMVNVMPTSDVGRIEHMGWVTTTQRLVEVLLISA